MKTLRPVPAILAALSLMGCEVQSGDELRPTIANCMAAFENADEVKYRKARMQLAGLLLVEIAGMNQEEVAESEAKHKAERAQALERDTSVILDECYRQVMNDELDTKLSK